MLIRTYSAHVALSLLSYTVAAQNIQTNNQGVIINVIVPRPRPEQHLYHPDNAFQANVMGAYQAQQQAVADKKREAILTIAAINEYENSLGEALEGSAIYQAVWAFTLHSKLQFDATDALGWSIPAGTRFRFRTAYGPGGHAEIQLLGLQVSTPAEYNGFQHTPGVRSNGYVRMEELQCEKTGDRYSVMPEGTPVANPVTKTKTKKTSTKPIDNDEAATLWNSLK